MLHFKVEIGLPLHAKLGQDWVEDAADSKDGDKCIYQCVDQDDWAYLKVCSTLKSESVSHCTSEPGQPHREGHILGDLALSARQVDKICRDENVEEAGEVQIDDRCQCQAPSHLFERMIEREQADPEEEEHDLLRCHSHRLVAKLEDAA